MTVKKLSPYWRKKLNQDIASAWDKGKALGKREGIVETELKLKADRAAVEARKVHAQVEAMKAMAQAVEALARMSLGLDKQL